MCRAILTNATKRPPITQSEPLCNHASISPFTWSMKRLNTSFFIASLLLLKITGYLCAKLSSMHCVQSFRMIENLTIIPNCILMLPISLITFSIELVNFVFVSVFRISQNTGFVLIASWSYNFPNTKPLIKITSKLIRNSGPFRLDRPN